MSIPEIAAANPRRSQASAVARAWREVQAPTAPTAPTGATA